MVDVAIAAGVFDFDPHGKILVQDGPRKEHGRNGVQLDEVLGRCLYQLRDYQQRLPCRQTAIAITKLEECLLWLADRTEDRQARGVEGTSKP